MLKELPGRFYQKDPDTDLPWNQRRICSQGTQLKVKQVSDRASDEWFKENGSAVYYEVQLKLFQEHIQFTGYGHGPVD